MLRFRYLLLACLLLGSANLSAQASAWEHYSYGEHVLAMAHSGNTLLIGTKTGLVKYDINTQQKVLLNKANSPLPDNWIAGVDISPSGAMLLGTPEGVCLVEGDNWQVFNMANSPFPSNHTYKTMFAPNGNLWVLSKGSENYDYLYSYANGEWHVQYHGNTNIPGQRIQDFTLDASGNPALVYYHVSSDITGLAVWDGTTWVNHPGTSMGVSSNYLSKICYSGTKYWMTDGYMIYSWDGTQSQAYDPDLPPVAEHHIISLGVDTQGYLLVGFYEPSGNESEAYLARFDGTNWTVYDPNLQVPGMNWPNAVLQTADGDLWIGTQSGAAYYDGVNWNRFVCSNSGLPSNNVYYMALDNQDRLWMTVRDYLSNVYALVKKDGNNWTVYGQDTIPGLYEPLYISAAPDGSVWFCNTDHSMLDSIIRFDGSTSTSYNSSNSIIPVGRVSAVEVDHSGNVWITVRKNQAPYDTDLLAFDGTAWHPAGTTSAAVKDIKFDATGNPWLATTQGLLRLEGSTLISYNTDNSGMTTNAANCLAFDAGGNLWIGTDFGLTKFSSDGNWQSWDPINGPYPLRHYHDIAIDNAGKVWGGTYSSGLVCFDGENWTSYTTQNSPLPTSGIRNLALDSQSRMWINTYWMGISCFDISSTPNFDPGLAPRPEMLQLTNYPNPFNPSTTITFHLKVTASVCLEVFNLRGQKVRRIFSGVKAAGEQSVVFDGRDDTGRPLASGVYVLKATAGKYTETRKLMLMK
jgi:ligand-binding sensor domain-containing protein